MLRLHQVIFRICFREFPAFTLTARVHQCESIFILKKNLRLMLEKRLFHLLALKPVMGYQLASKIHPRTLLKNPY